jgi:hypothetical protein
MSSRLCGDGDAIWIPRGVVLRLADRAVLRILEQLL